jgi:hypothetical protein
MFLHSYPVHSGRNYNTGHNLEFSCRLGFPAFLLALLCLILTTCTQQPPKDARHFHYHKKPVITLLSYTNIAIFAHTLGVAGNWELTHCS